MKLSSIIIVGLAGLANCHGAVSVKHAHGISTITVGPPLQATATPTILPRNLKPYTMADGQVIQSCPHYCDNRDSQYDAACCCCVPNGHDLWKRKNVAEPPGTASLPGVDYLPTQLSDVIGVLHGEQLAKYCLSQCTSNPYGPGCFSCVPNHKLFTLEVKNSTMLCPDAPYGAGCFSEVADMSRFLLPVAEAQAIRETGMQWGSVAGPCQACEEDRSSVGCRKCIADLHSKVWAM